MKQKKVYVVPHSHWDREWYFTIEDSNLLLVENMDRLLDVMENDPAYTGYVFDAQSSILDEYLKIRPEEKERLSKLISAKRIFVGPWYTQADSLLVNKESLIRNLLYGTRIAEKMGHSMNIGYLPDIFGQNTYLPSIFREFDIDYSVLQRGIYTDQLNGDLNFIWQSPDGKSVKANNLYYGYGPGKFLSEDDTYRNERLLPILEKLEEMNQSTDHLLLPAGGDQVLVREHFPLTVDALNEKDARYEYVLSDFETFMEETFDAEERFTNVIEGELIATEKSRIHNTIRSQRYDIKQLNAIAEEKIISQLEPLASIASTLGVRYPGKWLDEMWKMLFDVHAHDSIGGCNSDDTNREIVNRLTKVIRLADGCLNVIKKQMTQAVSTQTGKDSIFMQFHLLPKRFQGSQKAVIFTKEQAFSVKDLNGDLIEMDVLKQEFMSGGKLIVVTADGEKEVDAPGYYRNEILLQNLSLPAMGWQAFEVIDGEGMGATAAVTQPSESIENDFLRMTTDKGKLHLHVLTTDHIIEDLIQFENVADAGDSYDFSPLKNDAPILSKEAHSVHTETKAGVECMEVTHKLTVPTDLESRVKGGEAKELTIVSRFELRKGEPFIRVSHLIVNDVKDHRVRVLLKTSIEDAAHSFGDQGFSLIERAVENPYMKNWKERKFAEAPVPIYPLETFAGVSNETTKAAVITKGIKEYQVLETGEIALTLFRSVGLLGKDNLAWRPGRASGINNKVVTTPDAQMQGEWTFDYAIHVSAGGKEEELFSIASLYHDHQVSYQKQSLNSFEERLDRFEIPYPVTELPAAFSLFEITNKHVIFSSMKKAYDDDAVIVRLFNPTEDVQSFHLTSEHYQSLALTTLNEKSEQEAKSDVLIQPKGYVTVKLRVKGDQQ
ncbi:glycoside hydrolase family 38 C-terminal domain-containing protein [Jeotgalibacillus proteolyticus]|uniref:glycoside hydrolase family 38 N-terminal domain-containing protein n=1 Tax=Jeotgalibacillus proteolyticus TaxID=2082395 RepID=UPI003CF7C52C